MATSLTSDANDCATVVSVTNITNNDCYLRNILCQGDAHSALVQATLGPAVDFCKAKLLNGERFSETLACHIVRLQDGEDCVMDDGQPDIADGARAAERSQYQTG
jgi:hypothetical protein